MMGLSKSALDVFKSCPKCFWLDKNAKLKRPEGIKASIMIGIDDIMKKVGEFSHLNNTPHTYLADLPGAQPYHDRARLQKFMNWRTFQANVQAGGQSVLIWGQLDELIEWPDGRVSPHDYKSNGKERNWVEYTEQYNSLQADMYEILLKAQGLTTTGLAYFTYSWPVLNEQGEMRFAHNTVPFQTNEARALETIAEAARCLEGPEPMASPGCEYCHFVMARNAASEQAPESRQEAQVKPGSKKKAVKG